MWRKINWLIVSATLWAVGCTCGSGCVATPTVRPSQPEDVIQELSTPPGFRVTLYADVPNARAMALGPEGTLFVGSRERGLVHAVRDDDEDGRADRVLVIDRELTQPAGVDLHQGDLYVSAIDRILRYRNIERRLEDPPEPEVVTDELPAEESHGWKFIRFSPEGLLYVPVGAPCNVCESEQEVFATILRMTPQGAEREIFATGVRNTVGFDWHPETGELWFTDNGRDWLGDDRPPDELNHAPRPGLDFGFPHCHGEEIVDPDHGSPGACEDQNPPVQALGPHVAALGMRFYTGESFPEPYRGAIFIAEHGSWNRSTPIGYRVTVVRLDDSGAAVSYEPFVEGWLREDGSTWGRPADVLVMPDGALLVSDDAAGRIYRVAYHGS